MRPVNLIPPESRRGRRAPLRSGPLPYIAIGALVAVLVGVTALVLTGNQISESKADVTRLEARRRGRGSAGRKASPRSPSSRRCANSASRPSPASPTAVSTGSG